MAAQFLLDLKKNIVMFSFSDGPCLLVVSLNFGCYLLIYMLIVLLVV